MGVGHPDADLIMARKTKLFRITGAGSGRDAGKTFLLTEMSSEDSEEWGTRALFAMMNNGVEIPDDLLSAGLAAVFAIGIKSLTKVPYDLAKPLFDDMWKCVQFVPDGRAALARDLFADDIEEVATRLKIRKALLDLHLDFFKDAAPSTQAPDAAPQTAA